MQNLGLEEEKIIRDIRNLLRLKKETKAIKDRIHKDIKNLFEHEEEGKNCYKLVRVSNFGVTIILNTKVTVIETKRNHLRNI